MRKVIHYCWFGGKPLSDTAEKSLASWKRFAPGFELRQWNEDNFDFETCEWSRDAYAAKMWAFVADYARFKVLHEYGGIYMDVGSELIRDITPLLGSVPFTAIEESSLTATTGLIVAVEPHDPIIGACVARYESMQFSIDPYFSIRPLSTRCSQLSLRQLDSGARTKSSLSEVGALWTPGHSTPCMVSAGIILSRVHTASTVLRVVGSSPSTVSRGA